MGRYPDQGRSATTRRPSPLRPPDVTKLEKACQSGKGSSCTDAGYAWSHGQGVATDTNRAFTLYVQGCDLDNATSCPHHRRELRPRPEHRAREQGVLGQAGGVIRNLRGQDRLRPLLLPPLSVWEVALVHLLALACLCGLAGCYRPALPVSSPPVQESAPAPADTALW